MTWLWVAKLHCLRKSRTHSDQIHGTHNGSSPKTTKEKKREREREREVKQNSQSVSIPKGDCPVFLSILSLQGSKHLIYVFSVLYKLTFPKASLLKCF
jgi:hypothetical protein